jgi:hypothetical protein
LRHKLALRDLPEMFLIRGIMFSRHARFQGSWVQVSTRFLVPVAALMQACAVEGVPSDG